MRETHRLISDKSKLIYLGFLAPQYCASLFNDVLGELGGMGFPPFILCEAATALVIFFTHTRIPNTVNRIPCLISPAFCLLGLMAAVSYVHQFSLPSLIGISLCGGIGVASGYAKWIAFYCQLTSKEAMGCVLLCMVITGIFKFINPFIPITVQALLAVFLCLCAASWAKTFSRELNKETLVNPEKASRDTESSKKNGFSIRSIQGALPALIELLLFSSMLGYMNAFSSYWHASVMRYGLRLLCAVILFLVLYVYNKRINIVGFVQACLLLVVAAPITTAFAPEHADLFVTTGICLMQMLVWVASIEFTFSKKCNPSASFGLSWCLFAGGLGLGAILNKFISTTDFTVTIALFLVCLASLATVLALSHLQGFSAFLTESVTKPRDTLEKRTANAENYYERCRLLAERHCLTKRESEIMYYISKGRSKRYIAERLFISDNTVRMHTRHIYRKLGIHSKQELIDLVEDKI